MAKTVYIAGPMRGYPEFNFPMFDRVARMVRKAGWTVINPAELDRVFGILEFSTLPPEFLREAMRRDLPAICGCDAIALLPGWEDSAGVSVELALAKLLGLQIIPGADQTVPDPYPQ